MLKVKSFFANEAVRFRSRECYKPQSGALKITLLALFTAISIVVKAYSSTLTIFSFIRIGFLFLPVCVTGMVFGPVSAAVVAALADILGYFIMPVGGAMNLGITLCTALEAFVSAMVLYNRSVSVYRVILSRVMSAVVSIFCTTYFLTFVLGTPYFAMLPMRALKCLLAVPLEAIMLYVLAKALSGVLRRSFGRSGKNNPLTLNKGERLNGDVHNE